MASVNLRRLQCLIACAFGLLMVLVAPMAQGEDGQQYARVTADGLRVRADWSLEAAVLTGLSEGDIVEVLLASPSTRVIGEMEDYWYQVETPSGETGWVYGFFLDLFTRYESGGVAVCVDADIVSGVSFLETAAYTDGRSGTNWPSHVVLTIEGYALPRVSALNRRIYVLAADPVAGGGAGTIVSGAAERLRVLLAGPLVTGFNASEGDLRDVIPVVPQPSGSHQAFVSSAQTVSTDNGAGVRFLTQFVQDLVWPPSQTITYVYQGYTSDASAYISAWFQVQRPTVDSDAKPRPSNERIWEGYEEYGRELEAKNVEEFTPDLSLLDALVRSISVTW
jgi:Bacterial SH3 domain